MTHNDLNNNISFTKSDLEKFKSSYLLFVVANSLNC